MAKAQHRQFTDEDPAEFMAQNGGSVWSPLMISIAGYSGSGKSESALFVAEGIRRVIGGTTWAIDSEGGRLREKAGLVPFRRVPMDPPYRSDAYLQSIDYCVAKGASVIVVDNMSDEHNGAGGVLEQHEAYLDEKCGDDWSKRERFNQAGWVRVKEPRKRMERHFRALMEKGVVFVLTFRADEKYQPKTSKEKLVNPAKEEELSWKVDSTSEIPYMSTVRYVLMSGCDGIPLSLANAANTSEKKLMKVGRRYRDLLKPGEALSIAFGEKLGKLCRPAAKAGEGVKTQQPKTQPAAVAKRDESDGQLLFGAKYPGLGGQPIESASMAEIGKYIAYLQAIIDKAPDDKPKPANVIAHLEAVSLLFEQIQAEEALSGGASDEEAAQ